MRFLKGLFILFLCFACIFSCASASKNKGLYTNLTDDFEFYLLPAQDIAQTMDMIQYVSAVFAGNNYFFNALVIADKNSIEMALFNELGAGIGELSYSNGEIGFSSTVIPRAFLQYIKPEYIIADFQLCFYDPAMLEKALKNSGLVLEIQGRNRHISEGGNRIIDIYITDASVRLVNHLRDYTYTMEGDFSGIR